jgi:secondary thiamine-phosphate synthase enzyme
LIFRILPNECSSQFPDWRGNFGQTACLKLKYVRANSDAHIKSSLVGSSVTVPFQNGKLFLGRWQAIYLCEFDGERERKALMIIR